MKTIIHNRRGRPPRPPPSTTTTTSNHHHLYSAYYTLFLSASAETLKQKDKHPGRIMPHRRPLEKQYDAEETAWKILKIFACSQPWANHTGTQFPDRKNSLRPALISEVFKLHFMEYLEFIWPFQRNKTEEIIVIIMVSIVYSYKF